MGIPSFSGCTSGSYCSDQQATKVGDNQTQIYHRTVTTLTGQGPAYSGSKTETYIIKPNAAGIDTWTLAATTTDGGKTQTFTDAAGADFKKSMAPGGNMNKNVQAQVQKTLTAGGAKQGLVTLPGTSGSLEKITPEQQKALGIVSPNVGNSSTFDAENFSQSEGGKAKTGTRDNFKQKGPLIYPTDIGATKQDIIKFDMLKYRPGKFDSKTFGFSSRERTFSDPIGTVILPIPSGISDTNSCTWNGPEMNALQAGLANIALTTTKEGFEKGTDKIADVLGSIEKSAGDVGTAVAAAIAENASGARGLLTRTTGSVINPNLELLFQSPALRTFGFTFKMSARSENEAKTIIAILRFFKQGMSTQRSESNLFLKTPHTFGIRYIHRALGENKEHQYIGKIKECALLSFTVNYTPEGQYATFYDGPMVSYEMQMQFQELEPIFNDDYGKDDFNEIGF